VARHNRSYTGELLTAFLGLYLPPTMLTELKTAAANDGTTTSNLAREILSRHLAGGVAAARRRRDPHTATLVDALVSAGNANSANGNLFNQIARHLNTTDELGPFAADLREALGLYKRIAEMHKAALAKLTVA
jgi:hypothetical protein